MPDNCFFALVRACVAQTPLSGRYEGLPFGAVYSNGYLLSGDDEHAQLIVYGRDAKPAFSVPDWMGDAVFSTFAVDSDDTVAVAYQPRDGGKGYIELLDRGAKLTQTIRTGSDIPMYKTALLLELTDDKLTLCDNNSLSFSSRSL